MGVVMPFRRSVSVEQCRRASVAEEIVVGQMRLAFAIWRNWNRFWWGA